MYVSNAYFGLPLLPFPATAATFLLVFDAIVRRVLGRTRWRDCNAVSIVVASAVDVFLPRNFGVFAAEDQEPLLSRPLAEVRLGRQIWLRSRARAPEKGT